MSRMAASWRLSAAGAAEIQFKDSGTTFYSDYKKGCRVVDTGSQTPSPPTPPPPGP